MARADADALARGASVVAVPEQRTVTVASRRMRGRQNPDRRERDNDHAVSCAKPFSLIRDHYGIFCFQSQVTQYILFIWRVLGRICCPREALPTTVVNTL